MLWLLACAPAVEEAPCAVTGDPSLEVAPTAYDFGEFEDGGPLFYGVPPQGGALYCPFHARISGVADLDIGAHVDMVGVDPADESVLAETSYDTRLVCANVGESAGQWLGTDLHLRFGDWTIDALAGRALRLELWIENLDGEGAGAAIEGVLSTD